MIGLVDDDRIWVQYGSEHNEITMDVKRKETPVENPRYTTHKNEPEKVSASPRFLSSRL